MPEQHVYGWLRAMIARPSSNVERSKWMVFRQAVLHCFHHSGSRDRAGNKSNADGREWTRWKRLRGQSCPKAVAISRHGSKDSNPISLYEIVDVAPLHI